MDLIAKQLQRAALATIDRSSSEIRRGVSALESVAGVAYHEKWGDNVCWVTDRLKGQARDGVESLALAGAVPNQTEQANAKLSELMDACSVMKDSAVIGSPATQVTLVAKNLAPVRTVCLELSDGLATFAHQMRATAADKDRAAHRATPSERPKFEPGTQGL